MTISVYEVFSLNRAIEKLIENDIKMSFNDGYQFYQLKKELNDIEQYAAKRLNSVIQTEHLNTNQLTDDEQMIYLAVMNSEVNISDYDINLDKLKDNKELCTSLKDIMILYDVFGKKNVATSNENGLLEN